MWSLSEHSLIAWREEAALMVYLTQLKLGHFSSFHSKGAQKWFDLLQSTIIPQILLSAFYSCLASDVLKCCLIGETGYSKKWFECQNAAKTSFLGQQHRLKAHQPQVAKTKRTLKPNYLLLLCFCLKPQTRKPAMRLQASSRVCNVSADAEMECTGQEVRKSTFLLLKHTKKMVCNACSSLYI